MKRIQVSENDGLIVQNEVNPQVLRKIRLINFIEPFIAYGLVLAVIWISMLDMDALWMYIAFGVILLWVLFVSPWVHYEKLNEKEIFLKPEQRNFWFWFFECRGLGSPKKYFQKDESGKPGFVLHAKMLGKMTILWDILFGSAAIEWNQEYVEILGKINLPTTPPVQIGMGLLALLIIDVVLWFIVYPIFIRLDNFESGWNNQLRQLTLIGIPLVVIFNGFFQMFYPQLLDLFGTTGAFGMRGAPPLDRLRDLNIISYFAQWSGYVAWGWLQQLLFLSIFSTQFCRAFDLKNTDWGVYAAAAFSSLFFGLIHLPNFWLSIMTWSAGFCWAIAFMKCRNLMIMGVSHGMLGTLGNKLLPISYNVGPSSV
jgi:membrane protease YdiL (CAAX protease family)